MTLVLALANQDQVIHISDRRLTDAAGNPCVLPENKATILTLADSRLLVGFAGLARAGKFQTGEWILDALGQAGDPEHQALSTVNRFTDLLNQRFREDDLRTVSRVHRALSVMFTGYNDTRPPPNLIAAIVTNFQNFETGQDEIPWDDFKVTFWSLAEADNPEQATYIQRIGNWRAMEPADEPRLRQALAERKSPQAIIDIGCDTVRTAGERPAAENTIGADLNSAVLDFDRGPAPEAGIYPIQLGFHPKSKTKTLYGPNQVISMPDLGMQVMSPTITLESCPDGREYIATKKVGRNKPCPCGSGLKYKRCHGK